MTMLPHRIRAGSKTQAMKVILLELDRYSTGGSVATDAGFAQSEKIRPANGMNSVSSVLSMTRKPPQALCGSQIKENRKR